jgi:C-terminal processing protease CtpA/Prc
VAAGYVSALLIQSIGTPTVPLSGDGAEVGASATKESRSGREFAELQEEIASLNGELAAERIKNATAAPDVASTAKTPEEIQELVSTARKKIRDQKVHEENNRLLAAGVSMNRIQWLRERSAQLVEDRRRAETERRMQGLPVDIDLDYLSSNEDLDLRNEIGVEAYENYRMATGRQISVPISSVLTGSIAERVGLKPGDKIITYDNQRVYDMGQITKISDKAVKAGASVMLEVRRGGVPMRFTVPAGTLGITTDFVVPGGRPESVWSAVSSQSIQPSGKPD